MTWAEYIVVNGREYRCFFLDRTGVSSYLVRRPDGTFVRGQKNKVYDSWVFTDPTPTMLREMEIAVVAHAYGVTPDEVRSCMS